MFEELHRMFEELHRMFEELHRRQRRFAVPLRGRGV